MKLKPHMMILIAFFLISIGARLYFTFQTSDIDQFSTDNSYFVIRQVQYIVEGKGVLFEDPLSFNGRMYIFSPFFHYLLAGFSLFMPVVLAAKIIPNILASTLVFVTYLLAFEITKNRKVSLFTSFFAAFIPIYFAGTFNSVSLYSLAIPLILLCFYLFLVFGRKDEALVPLIICLAVLIATTPSVVLFLAGLVFYYLLTKVDRLQTRHAEVEFILFSLLLFLWFELLIFKNAFLLYGTAVIWQNSPVTYLATRFSQFQILDAVIGIGVVPFLFGMYLIVAYTFRIKKRAAYLLSAMALTTMGLLWLRMIPSLFGLMFLGAVMVVLFSMWLKDALLYFRKTKFAKLESMLLALIIILFFFSSVVPSIYLANKELANVPSSNVVESLKWMGSHTEGDRAIFATPYYGYMINYFTQRKDVADSNFLLLSNVDQTLNDIERVYTSFYKTDAIPLLNKYDAEYLLITPRILRSYNITRPAYLADSDCFPNIYNESGVEIYRVACVMEAV